MVYKWSYSRLSKVEECGLQFMRTYVMGERGESTDALRKGSLVHEVLEVVKRRAMVRQYAGPMDLDKIVGLYGKIWAKHYPDGGSAAHFRDGEQLVADWVERERTIDHTRIVDVEKHFSLPLPNGDRLIGFIDVIERDADGVLVIKDYKTNRAMFSRDEVDESLQLGIYGLAARMLWPGQRVRLCYDMLRHGFCQYTERTDEQLDSLERYIMTLVSRVDKWKRDQLYPPTLNKHCGWCHHRQMCPLLSEALESGDLDDMTPSGWDGLAHERERMAAIEKAARARRSEIDGQIKTHIKHEGALDADGRTYALSKTVRRTHDPTKVAEMLSEALGESVDHWLGKVTDVSSDKLKRAIKGSALDTSEQIVLQTKIDGLAKQRISTMLRSSKAKG